MESTDLADVRRTLWAAADQLRATARRPVTADEYRARMNDSTRDLPTEERPAQLDAMRGRTP